MQNRISPSMSIAPAHESFSEEAGAHFARLVDSVGIKRFAAELGLSTRQINRMLKGAQPNPVERIVRCLQAAEVQTGDRALDFICQELGGHFVRHESVDMAIVNAVKECAEAIAAISDGHVSQDDIQEVREAISALTSLINASPDDELRDDQPPDFKIG